MAPNNAVVVIIMSVVGEAVEFSTSVFTNVGVDVSSWVPLPQADKTTKHKLNKINT